MILNWLSSNIGTAITILTLIGGWFIFLGRFRQQFDDMKKDFDRSREEVKIDMEKIDKDIEKINEKMDHQEEKFTEHLADPTPHKACLVETSRHADNVLRLDELNRSIRRVENWVMALAAKAGVKEPRNGD